MAQTYSTKKSDAPRRSLWYYVAPVKEARENTEKPAVSRFKYFRAVHKTYSTQLILLNLLTMVCFLPMLAVVFLVQYMSIEGFSYLLQGITKEAIPYYMGSVGIGLSQGTPIAVGAANMLFGREFEFWIIAACMPLGGVGLAGLFHVANKMLWREPFTVYKKNKLGMYQPRVIREFFIGIKKYWLPTVLIMTVFGLVFAGVSTSIFYLAIDFQYGIANAGQWVLAIIACIVGLYVALMAFSLLPMVSQYDCKYSFRLRNASIFAIKQALPLIFVLGIIILIAYLSMRSQLWSILFVLFAAMWMFELLVLITTNLSHYMAENITTPLYEQAQVRMQRAERKKAKKR